MYKCIYRYIMYIGSFLKSRVYLLIHFNSLSPHLPSSVNSYPNAPCSYIVLFGTASDFVIIYNTQWSISKFNLYYFFYVFCVLCKKRRWSVMSGGAQP